MYSLSVKCNEVACRRRLGNVAHASPLLQNLIFSYRIARRARLGRQRLRVQMACLHLTFLLEFASLLRENESARWCRCDHHCGGGGGREEEVAIDDSRGSNNGRLISPLTTHYAPSLPLLPSPPPHFPTSIAQHPRLTATWRIRCQLIPAARSPCPCACAVIPNVPKYE